MPSAFSGSRLSIEKTSAAMGEAEIEAFSHRWTISNFSLLCGDMIDGHPVIKTETILRCFYLFPRGKDENDKSIGIYMVSSVELFCLCI